MKKIMFLVCACYFVMSSCQKSVSDYNVDNGTAGADSLISAGDTITYEILTADANGWSGMWNEPDGTIGCNPLDSITYGSPEYYPDGWKHSFICPNKPFQAFISVATTVYDQDITANLYKNGKLIKSVTNDAMKGVAKLLVTADTDTLIGTASYPVLTYEVLISDADSAVFEPDAWTGQWNMPDGKVNNITWPSLTLLYALPSGWRHTFKPEYLPFTMYLAGGPYTWDAATITINFYVNGQLVKTISSRNFIYGNTYVVQ
jgi:hypothetical protein